MSERLPDFDDPRGEAQNHPSLGRVRARAFAFVKNNPLPEEVEAIRAYITGCPEGYWDVALVVRHLHGNLTPHLHILLKRRNAIKLSTILRRCPALQSCHFDKVINLNAMYAYMQDPMKVQETVVSIGTPGPGQGHRTDHDEVASLILDGATVKDVWRENPGYFMKYHSAVSKAVSMEVKPRNSDHLKIYILYGASGTGKSVHARRLCESLRTDAYWTSYSEGRGVIWWDGYDRQEVVVLDEFRGQVPLLYLNRLLDYGPFRAQLKGGTVEVVASTFIVCSNYLPCHWYTNTARKQATLLAFMRRLRQHSTCFHFLRAEDDVRRGPDGLPTFVANEDYDELTGEEAALAQWFTPPDPQIAEFNFNRRNS